MAEHGEAAGDPQRAAERSEQAADASERFASQANSAASDAAESAALSVQAAQQVEGVGRAQSVMADAEDRAAEQRLLAEYGVDAADPELQQELRKLEAGADEHLPYGPPGKPLPGTSPFRVGFFAALGVVAAGALAWAAVAAAQVLVLVGVSLFLAVGLDPAVRRLVRRGMSRRVAVAVVATVVALGIGGFVAIGIPPLVRQANTLRAEAPQYAEQLTETSVTMAEIDRRFDVVGRLQEMLGEAELLEEGDSEELISLARGAITAAAATLTVLVLTVYFLASLPAARMAAERLVPRSRRARTGLLTEGVLERIGGYVFGKVITAVFAGVAAFVVLVALGVPHAIALGLFVAVTDVIPVIGALVGAAAAIAVALTVSLPAALIALAFFVVYQQFENLWLLPRVMKHTIDISPAATLVAALVGGALSGIVGALIAIPIAASVKLLIEQVVVPAQETR